MFIIYFLCVCVCVYHTCAEVHRGQEKDGIRSSGSGVPGSYEVPRGCCKLNPDLLKQQSVLLTSYAISLAWDRYFLLLILLYLNVNNINNVLRPMKLAG